MDSTTTYTYKMDFRMNFTILKYKFKRDGSYGKFRVSALRFVLSA